MDLFPDGDAYFQGLALAVYRQRNSVTNFATGNGGGQLRAACDLGIAEFCNNVTHLEPGCVRRAALCNGLDGGALRQTIALTRPVPMH